MKRTITILGMFISCLSYTMGQGTQSQFGKNVVQYKGFQWVYYQTKNYDVYFYEGGKEPARFLVEKGDEYLKEIEKGLEYQTGEKFSFLVYNSYSDFRQSNYHANDEVYNIGGITPITGNKAFIYFNGNHADFVRQIKAGFARLTLTDLMSGGNISQRVQNSVFLNIPTWFTEGLIRYLSDDWNPYWDNKLKQGIISERYRNFKTLTEDEQIIAGHSLWKYVREQYGAEAVSNIVFNARAYRSMQVAFQFVLGKTFEEVFDNWFDYNLKRYTGIKGENPVTFEEIKGGKVFKRGLISRWEINGTGTKAAFVTNNHGKIKLWVLDLETHKQKCIYRTGYRRTGEQDYSYPVIAWNPTRDILTVFYENHGEPYYFNYNANTNKKEDKQVISSADYILDASYSQNGRFIVASAIKKGQSDIFLFDQRTQFFKPITDDIYDDRQPHFVNNSKGIVFTSNRPNNKVAKVTTEGNYKFNTNFDIFYFPDFLAQPRTMKRISKGNSDELMPDNYDSTYLSYLTSENGVLNRNAARYDSLFQYIRVVAEYKTETNHYDTFRFFKNNKNAVTIDESVLRNPDLIRLDTEYIYKDTVYTYHITDYTENVLSYHVNPKYRTVFELFQYDGKYRLYKRPTPAGMQTYKKPRTDNNLNKSNAEIPKRAPDLLVEITDKEELKDTTKKLSVVKTPPKAYFQTEFPEPIYDKSKENIRNQSIDDKDSVKRALLFRGKTKKQNKFAAEALYFTSFTPDQIVTQIDNSINTSPYLPYKQGDALSYSPTLNGVFKLGISDLFKDYRLLGGVGIQPDLTGAEYFLTLENLKKRVDKRFTFYRKGKTDDNGNGNFIKNTSLEGRAELRYPFSETFSIRGSVFGRQDQTTYLSGDRPSLEKAPDLTYWTGSKEEFVFDNTLNQGLNARTGTRFKLYSEIFDALNKKKTLFATIGGDLRTYTKISRQLIWANRLAYGTSVGTAKVLYFLGGADGWMIPKTSENTPDPNQNYVYKLDPGNLRGFDQNIRNGNSFALLNSELRLPIVKYFLNRPIRSQIIENLQAVTFFDAGSAWLGFLPTGENNAYQTKYIYNNPLVVKVVTNRDPFVYGYGFGMRTTLLGYFLKADVAWGVENSSVKQAQTYLSMGLDF